MPADIIICNVLAYLFNLCVQYCFLSAKLVKIMVISIVKNKTGNRLISLATVVVKVFKRLIQAKITPFLKICGAQFGIRSGLSTDMVLFSLKQVVNNYVDRKTIVYACFLDLGRTFDYSTFWEKLSRQDVPNDFVDLLAYW